MKKLKAFVLGSGINGTIISLVKDIPCIGNDISGYINSEFGAPKILEWSESVSKFISKYTNIKSEDFNLYRCGYYAYGRIYGGDITEFIKFKYAEKTLRQNMPKSIMSASNSVIKGYNLEDVYNDIRNKVSAVNAHIERIERYKGRYIIICDKGEYEAEKIYNTLPYPILCNLLNIKLKKECKAADIYYYIYTGEDLFPSYYDYIYIIDESIPHYRITRSHNSVYTAESLIPEKKIQFRDKNITFEKEMIFKNAKMMTSYPDTKSIIKGIINIGRYANWNHSLKVNHVIEQMM